jgi:hypothetical protein
VSSVFCATAENGETVVGLNAEVELGGTGLRPAAATAPQPLGSRVLIGVPFAWAILLFLHPGGEGEDLYSDLRDQVTRMLVVHIEMLLFIPVMAVVVYILLRGVEGTAALVSRVALAFYVVFYGAWEAIYGIGLGILGDAVNGLPEAERATGAAVIQDYGEHILIRGFGVLVSIGSVALIIATIAAGIALRRHAGAPLAVPILLGLSGFLITAHRPPSGLPAWRSSSPPSCCS